jgi:hypothetical protein
MYISSYIVFQPDDGQLRNGRNMQLIVIVYTNIVVFFDCYSLITDLL